MNLFILCGLALIAVGSGLTIYGGIVVNRKDSLALEDKVEKVLAEVAVAKKDANPKERESLDAIEKEFLSWAADFHKNKNSRQLQLEQEKLDVSQREIKYSSQAHAPFTFLINCAKQIVLAYQQESKQSLQLDLTPIPENMYTDAGSVVIGTLKFRPQLIWKFAISARRPPNYRPDLILFVSDNSKHDPQEVVSKSLNEAVHIVLWEDGKHRVYVDGHFPLAQPFSETYTDDEYKKNIPLLLQRIFERQILTL
jgi:hypothetical protein